MFRLSKPMKITTPLKLLILADFHHAENEEFEILKNLGDVYDACFCLGDIKNAYLQVICDIVDKPIYGVLGNHDGFETMDGLNITNIHGKVIQIGGLRFAGWQGSFKYKNGEYPSFTQAESVEFCKSLPTADVLISHDSPYKLYGDNSAHIGLKGISKYINKVPINIHGHQHVNKISDVKGTKVIGVYRAAIVDVSNLEVNILF